MTRIDQFESAFLASAKQLYSPSEVEIGRVLVITDLDDYEAKLFGDGIRGLLAVLMARGEPTWTDVPGDRFTTVAELLEVVEEERPDLICSYRNLHSGAWRWPHSLGSHLDVLTQVTTTPVLVLPHPRTAERGDGLLDAGTHSVMAITDHLTGDDRLVDHAVAFTSSGGTLYLGHVEDSAVFARYVEVISKIPGIETEAASEEIRNQLLKEPADWVRSCRETLERKGVAIEVREEVRMGHHLSEYKRLIEEHRLDLLVFNTKDAEQLAMHGLAYSLAVELRDIPLLML